MERGGGKTGGFVRSHESQCTVDGEIGNDVGVASLAEEGEEQQMNGGRRCVCVVEIYYMYVFNECM